MKNRMRRFPYPLLLGACIVAISAVSVVSSPCAEAANAVETIRIGGTGTALATMRQLGEQFHRQHPGVEITVYPSLGSAGGIKALAGGDIDIAVSYKKPEGDGQNKGLKAMYYGKTPFVFVSFSSNRVSNITLKEAVDIYDGKIVEWPDGLPVRLIVRPASEASTIILRGMSPDMDRAVNNALARRGLPVAITDQENVSLLENLPGSFGAAPLCQLISEKRNVKVLSIDGVTPSVRTLAQGKYPYYKELFMITGPKSSPSAGKFIDFVFSGEGQAFLTQTGHLVPVHQK
jgi:phosphate transport system substrate-binding protein